MHDYENSGTRAHRKCNGVEKGCLNLTHSILNELGNEVQLLVFWSRQCTEYTTYQGWSYLHGLPGYGVSSFLIVTSEVREM